MRSALGGLSCLFAIGAASAGCADDASDAEISSTAVVVGVTSDLLPGVDVARLRVVMRADGEILRDQTLSAFDADAPIALPTELRFSDLPGGTKVEVSLEAYQGYYSDEEPLVVRDASTEVVAGKTLLLRARIEEECIPSFRLAADLVTPTCARPQTCIAAACADPFVPPAQLEAYSSTWADVFADACKPAAAEDPIVTIGEGQAAFRSLVDDKVVQVESGPHGGFHVWLSVRMKNLHQAGSKTFVDIYELGADEPMVSFTSGQSYRPDESGSCELLGIRCQLTFQDTMDVEDLLGDTLRAVVRVADPVGDVGAGEQLITLSGDVAKP